MQWLSRILVLLALAIFVLSPHVASFHVFAAPDLRDLAWYTYTLTLPWIQREAAGPYTNIRRHIYPVPVEVQSTAMNSKSMETKSKVMLWDGRTLSKLG